MLSIPFAFQSCGWVVSISLMLMTALMYERTCAMQIMACEFVAQNNIKEQTTTTTTTTTTKDHLNRSQSGSTNTFSTDETRALLDAASSSSSSDGRGAAPLKTYEEVMSCLMGSKWKIAVQVSKILLSYGACISYCVATSDFLYDVLNESFDVQVDKIILIYTVPTLISLPLSLLPTMNLQKYTSFAGILSIIYVTIVIVILLFVGVDDSSSNSNDDDDDGDLIAPLGRLSAFNVGTDTIRAIPVFFFSLGAHIATVTVYNELAHKPDFQQAIRYSYYFVCTIYTLVGIGAGATFGSDIEDNILNAYPYDQAEVTVARILFSFTLLFSYPVLAFSARETIWVIIHPDAATDLLKPGYRYPLKYYLISIVFYLVVVVPASLISNLSTVFGLTGATAGAALYSLFPSVMYLKVLSMKADDPQLICPSLPVSKSVATFFLYLTIALGSFAAFSILLQDVGVL